MEAQETIKEKLLDTAGDLVETYRELITLRVVENASLGISVSIVGTIVLVLSCFTLLFAAVGLAWWVGESLNDLKAGFFIVGAGFMVIAIVLLTTSGKLIIPAIRNIMIRKFYDED